MTPQDKYLAANGLRLHYLDWGNSGKRPLLLTHGFGSQAHAFDHKRPCLSPGIWVALQEAHPLDLGIMD